MRPAAAGPRRPPLPRTSSPRAGAGSAPALARAGEPPFLGRRVGAEGRDAPLAVMAAVAAAGAHRLARDVRRLLLGIVLGLVAQRQLDVLHRWLARRELPAALDLGVELLAEEDGEVGEPDPAEQGDRPAERAVGLVVGTEVLRVEEEADRRDHPDGERDDGARREPVELREPR